MIKRIALLCVITIASLLLLMGMNQSPHDSGHQSRVCAEDAVYWRQMGAGACVHLDNMTGASRAYALEWIGYCGNAFPSHRFVAMRFDQTGRMIVVRCVRAS